MMPLDLACAFRVESRNLEYTLLYIVYMNFEELTTFLKHFFRSSTFFPFFLTGIGRLKLLSKNPWSKARKVCALTSLIALPP